MLLIKKLVIGIVENVFNFILSGNPFDICIMEKVNTGRYSFIFHVYKVTHNQVLYELKRYLYSNNLPSTQ